MMTMAYDIIFVNDCQISTFAHDQECNEGSGLDCPRNWDLLSSVENMRRLQHLRWAMMPSNFGEVPEALACQARHPFASDLSCGSAELYLGLETTSRVFRRSSQDDKCWKLFPRHGMEGLRTSILSLPSSRGP